MPGPPEQEREERIELTPQTRGKTLEELDGRRWGPPTFGSYLVTICHRLRQKRLSDFTAEDLRIMIGQDIGSEYLVPLALETLRDNPLAAGDFYPGDLLSSVLRLKPGFWAERPGLQQAVIGLAVRAESELERSSTVRSSDADLVALIRAFIGA